jgi:hypothetical protein
VRPVLALLAAAAATFALTACDADVSQSDDREPVPDRVRTGLAALYAGPSPSAEVAAEGECFADALDERLTLDQLVDAGLVRDDGEATEVAPMLDVDVADAWVDAMGACTTYVDVATRTALADDPGLAPTAYADCLTGAVPDGRVREALVATLTGRFGTDPAAVELAAAQERCARLATS